MNSSKKGKRSRESSESNKSFVKNVTSRMSELLPSTITKWFSSPSPNANGSATVVDASDSSTEDEASDSPPPTKMLRLSPTQRFMSINTKSTSTNTEPTDFIQNPIHNSQRIILKRDPNYMSTPFIPKSEESTTKTSDSENKVAYILKNSLASGDTSVIKTRKTLFNCFNNDNLVKKEDKPHADHIRDLNRSTYNKSSLLRSAFYPGPTTYGGAASTSYLKHSNIHNNKNTVVNDTKNNESLNVSRTTRKIMDLLENYSSPLIDAKRISQYVKPKNSINKSINSSSCNPHCKKIISYKTQELHVPSIASILSIKRKSRLMATTSAARQLIASHSSSASASPYPTAPDSSAQEIDGSGKLVTKIKASVTKNKNVNFAIDEPLNLPTAVLQIDTDNLPKFSFESLVPKPNETTSCFSLPIPRSNTEPVMTSSQSENVNTTSLLTLTPIASTKQCKFLSNNSSYTFSNPVTVSNEKVTSNKLPVFTFLNPERTVDGTNADCIKNDSVLCNVGMIQEKMIKTTDVKDWKCSDCWVPNKPDLEKCICCGSKKPEVNGNKKCPSCNEETLSETIDICSKCKTNQNDKQEMKVTSDSSKWKCQDCWVSNDTDRDNCICCGGKKPVISSEVPKVEDASLTTKVNDSKWKCEDCWVSNDIKDEQCVCCGGKKLVKKPEVSKQGSNDKVWKCDVCLLENGHSAVKCVACLTPKPNTNIESKPVNNTDTPNFQTGSSNILQDIVKSQSQKWECPFCLVHNENTISQCVCCDSERPGSTKQTETKFNFGFSPSKIFKFGIDPNIASEKEKNEEKKPEVKETNNNVLPKTSFTFGIPPQDNVIRNEADKPLDPPKPVFSFGIPTELQSKPQIPNNDISSGKEEIPKFTLESEKVEKPQEVPNVDSTNTETQKPKLHFSSTLFSNTSSAQSAFNLPSTTASLTLCFNNTSSVSTSQIVNNEDKPTNIQTSGIMSVSNFFKAPTSTAIESPSASFKPAQAPADNSNVNLFQKNEPVKTGINFTAPPLFKKSEEQQPAASTSLFPNIDPQTSLNTTLSPFKKSEMPPSSMKLFNTNNPLGIMPKSTFALGLEKITNTYNFPKSDITTTTQSVNSSAPIFSFGMNNQPAPSAAKPKFNFTFGNNNQIGASMFSGTNTNTPAFGGIGDTNVNKFSVPASSTSSSNVFSSSSSGNGLSSGSILGGNGLGASLGSNNLSSLNTGNTLQNNIQLPVAQGTGIFGATQKENNSSWPASNNTLPNIFSTTASTNAVQKPPAFSFGSNNMSFNINNGNVPVFGANTQPSQNVFNLSNPNNNNMTSLFSSPSMFGGSQPVNNSAPAIGLFGQQAAPAFGSNTFEPSQNSAPPPAFNFGSPQTSSVFGFGQQAPQQAQQSQQPQQAQSGVYSFGSPGAVQFAVGSAPGAAPNVRRVKKVVRRTTQR